MAAMSLQAGNLSTLATRRLPSQPTLLQTQSPPPLRVVLSSRSRLFLKERYDSCKSHFEKMLRNVESGESKLDLVDAHDNFIFWGSEYGTPNGTLDKTLEKATPLRSLILECMLHIENVLDRVKEHSCEHSKTGKSPSFKLKSEVQIMDTQSKTFEVVEEDVDLVSELNRAIGRLYALAPSLAQPNPTDDIGQPTEHFDIEEEVHKVEERFPKADKELKERLGSANWLRRNRLFAWRLEYDSLKKGGKYQDRGAGLDPDSEACLPVSSPTGYANLPFEWVRRQHSENERDKQGGSRSSFEDENILPGTERVLNAYPNGDFECPYCFQVLTEIRGNADWRHHVLQDLEPYICTIGGCSQTFRCFRTKEDWLEHEKSVHNVRGSETPLVCSFCIRDVENVGYSKHLATHMEDLAVLVLPDLDGFVFRRPCVPFVDPSSVPLSPESEQASESDMEDPSTTSQHITMKVDEITKVFKPSKFLGAGSYAWVDSVNDMRKHRGGVVARKTILLPGYSDGKMISKTHQQLRRQCASMRQLQHDHLVRFVGSYETDDATMFCVLMSPIADFDLATYLDMVTVQNKSGNLPPEITMQLKQWFGCLANGLSYIHSEQILNGDIKPQNILVKGRSVLFTGFGISTKFADHDDSTSFTRIYAAPEVLTESIQSEASDVFSLGCVFLEIYSTIHEKPLSELRECLRTGYDASFGNNLGKAMKWLWDLQVNAEPLPEGLPAEWAFAMMREEQADRITAEALLRKIRASQRRMRSKFIGPCCTGDSSDSECHLLLRWPIDDARKEHLSLNLERAWEYCTSVGALDCSGKSPKAKKTKYRSREAKLEEPTTFTGPVNVSGSVNLSAPIEITSAVRFSGPVEFSEGRIPSEEKITRKAWKKVKEVRYSKSLKRARKLFEPFKRMNGRILRRSLHSVRFEASGSSLRGSSAV